MRISIQQVFSSSKLVIMVVVVLCALAYADTPPSWSRVGSFAGSGEDGGNAVKIDKFGNRYVTGLFSATATFNGQTLASHGDTDIFLAKFAQDGSLLWLVQIGGAGNDESGDIAFDFQGNVYLTGWFTNSASFGSANGAVNTRTGTGETIFLAKYSTSGNLVWARKGTIPDVHTNRGHGLAINLTAGSIYMTGVSQEATSFTSADGHVYTVPGSINWHMFLVKYDLRGQFLWGESNQASPNSIPRNVAVDANDNAYVTGWF
jgi:hypothetical protein